MNEHGAMLPAATQEALAYLEEQTWLKRSKWYLAGGTALALSSGHRVSIDLDFFIPQKDFSAARLLGHFPKSMLATDIMREGTIYGRLLGAKISFIACPFFIPKRPYRWHGSIRVLDPHDIAVMKIIAISQRGRKRDFVDLYWCAQHLEALADIIRRLPVQYPNIAHDYHHILKSLTYFTDAEEDPMPRLYFDASWKDIKKYFQNEIPGLAREFLRL